MFERIKRLFGKEERAVTYQTGVSVGLIPAPSYSGMPVTEQTALGISSLLCGIRVLSEAVGSLPPILCNEDDRGQTPAKSHPLYRVLKDEPNKAVTRPVLWESFVSSGILYGNGYLKIERDNGGRPVALWNVHPLHVRVGRQSDTGLPVYVINLSSTGGPPGSPGTEETLSYLDMIHVPFNVTPDGSVGYRLLNIARETIGFALGAQRYGASLFRNMGRPAGVIDVPPNVKLSDEGEANLRRSFQQNHAGDMVGSVAVLQQGHKFTPFNLATNEQTQYADLLNFFVYEVARLLNVPPFKLHSLDEATWNNATQQNEAFLSTSLRPMLERIEAECEKKLLMPNEKGKFCIEFDVTELLRADQATRYQNQSVALAGKPFKTVNEVRADEGLPPVEGGDDLAADAKTDQADKSNTDQPEADMGDTGVLQDAALNGAQVTSLLMLTDKVVSKEYPADAAKAIIAAAFPLIPSGTIAAIVDSLAAAPAPELPAPVVPNAEPDPTNEDKGANDDQTS